jgi:hypothetical protein
MDSIDGGPAEAEQVVLEELAAVPQFAIAIRPRGEQRAEEIKAAVERGLRAGWIEIGPARSCDPRARLLPAGRAELRRRHAVSC